MSRLFRRTGYELLLLVLIALIVVAGLFVLTVALPELTRTSAAPNATPARSASPRPLVMSWVDLPANADCSACHVTAQGGVGLVPVPRMAHPLRGWTDCTACHANDRLVQTAPGHAGLHAQDCLLCHEPDQLPAPLSRPHRELQNQECLSCHGSAGPLPEDMAHRPESVCWLCHRLPEEEPPLPAHAIVADQTDCLECHGRPPQPPLPDDHLTRTADECLLCHAPQPGGTPGVPLPSAGAPTARPASAPPGQSSLRYRLFAGRLGVTR